MAVQLDSSLRPRRKVDKQEKSTTELELERLSNNCNNLVSTRAPQLDEETGYAPIHKAAYSNEASTVKALLDKDESLCECLTCYGETPIMIACLNGSLEVVKCLLEHHANLRHETSTRKTAVHYAASSGCAQTLSYVLSQAGMTAYANYPDQMGDTPAHYAMRAGCVDCVRVLRGCHVDFNQQNQLFKTPIDVAEPLGNVGCLCEATTVMDGIQNNPSLSDGPPESLRNDAKAEFHGLEVVESDMLLQGNNLSTSQDKDRPNGHSGGRPHAATNGHGHITKRDGRTHDSAARDQSSRVEVLLPTQPMKPKTMMQNIPLYKDTVTDKGPEQQTLPTQPMKPKTMIRSAPLLTDTPGTDKEPEQQTPPTATTPNIVNSQCTGAHSLGENDIPLHPTQKLEEKNRVKLASETQKQRDVNRLKQMQPIANNHVTSNTGRDRTSSSNGVQICSTCGREKTTRKIHIKDPSGITAGHTDVAHADFMQYTESVCYYCTRQSSNKRPVQSHGSTVGSDMRRIKSKERRKSQKKSGNQHPADSVHKPIKPQDMKYKPSKCTRKEWEPSGCSNDGDTESEPEKSDSREIETTESENESIESGPTETEAVESEGMCNVGRENLMRETDRQDESRSPTPESDISDWTTPYEQDESSAYNQRSNVQEMFESGYHTLPGASQMHGTPIKIEEDIPQRIEEKFGEEVTLSVKATTNSSNQLKYCWYQVKGGRLHPVNCETSELKWKIETRITQKLFCRICLKNSENTFVDSTTTSISPKHVWFRSSLHFEGRYYGKKAVLRCQAETHNSDVSKLSYLWFKGTSLNDRPTLLKKTSIGELIFDDFCTEHDGYYICQADVGKGYFDETAKIHVKGCNEPTFQITKQPRSRVVTEGDSFTLQCRAEFKTGFEGSLTYQWFHNNTAIKGASSQLYARRRAVAGDTGHYYCKVAGEGGASISTHTVTVALAYKEGPDTESGPRSMQQIDQIKAEKILQTKSGKRYATDKVAILLGNTEYAHLCKLNSCVADVQQLKPAFIEAGFKVISLVNLSCEETMHALKSVKDLLVAGVYVVCVYSGHGCTIQTTNFIIPVDAHTPINPSQCIAHDTVCEYLQSKLCRVFLIMNCCSSSPEGSYQLPQYLYKCNYGNKVIMKACLEGHSAYEVGAMSSFITAFVAALREGGSYKRVFEKVQEKMRTSYDSDGRSMFPRPLIIDSGMDKEITFQDDIMLDDESLEETLDQLQETCKAINTPPDPVTLTEDLHPVLQDVKLLFECECSNVLVVVVKWNKKSSPLQTTDFIRVTVNMSPEGQGVEVERLSMTECEARFRVSALQRLSGDLQLHLMFTISSSAEATPPQQHTVTYNLKSRPLYSLYSCT